MSFETLWWVVTAVFGAYGVWSVFHEHRDRRLAREKIARLYADANPRIVVDTTISDLPPHRPLDVRPALRRNRRNPHAPS